MDVLSIFPSLWDHSIIETRDQSVVSKNFHAFSVLFLILNNWIEFWSRFNFHLGCRISCDFNYWIENIFFIFLISERNIMPWRNWNISENICDNSVKIMSLSCINVVFFTFNENLGFIIQRSLLVQPHFCVRLRCWEFTNLSFWETDTSLFNTVF